MENYTERESEINTDTDFTEEIPMTDGQNANHISVTRIDGDVRRHDFQEGVTVGEYIERSEFELGQGAVVTVDGTPAQLDDMVAAGSVISVTSAVANG